MFPCLLSYSNFLWWVEIYVIKKKFALFFIPWYVDYLNGLYLIIYALDLMH